MKEDLLSVRIRFKLFRNSITSSKIRVTKIDCNIENFENILDPD